MTVTATIPIIVAAKNEERSLGATLASLDRARSFAERARPDLRFVVNVVLDDTTDGSARVAAGFERTNVLPSSGGKVEAQRAGLAAFVTAHEGRRPRFAIFCDADVTVSETVLLALTVALDSDASVHVATCRLVPRAPRRSTLLAGALHTYNRRRGFSTQRTWFNGKLFAMRDWSVPPRAEVLRRAKQLPFDAFYDFEAGLVVDDIYLSRIVVAEHGPRSIVEVAEGEVSFRAPETLRGMNRYYRRMRREIERLDRLFPETAATHRTHGRRTSDLRASAPAREKLDGLVFDAALLVCRIAYRAERAWVTHVVRRPRPAWPPVEETKEC